jgi:hypothetical protein
MDQLNWRRMARLASVHHLHQHPILQRPHATKASCIRLTRLFRQRGSAYGTVLPMDCLDVVESAFPVVSEGLRDRQI